MYYMKMFLFTNTTANMTHNQNAAGTLDHADSISETITEGIENDSNSEEGNFDIINSGQSISPQPSQDIQTSSPRPPSEYPLEFLITYSIRQAQRTEETQRYNRSKAEEQRIEQEFDIVVIKYARNALDEIGFRAPIEKGYVVGLILAHIRRLKIRPFGRHLNEHPETRKRLNITGGTSFSTFNRKNNRLSEETRSALEDAARHVLYSVYRVGHDIPRSVAEAHEEVDGSPLYLENKFPRRITDEVE